jgi:GH3 auxin-responsive promoter
MLDATPLLRLYARARLARLAGLDEVEAQRRKLLALVRAARGTRFGRDHGFAGITDVASYQSRVPLRRYEQFWDEYWKDDYPRLRDCTWPGTIQFFAVTSGTTSGITKNIPCSRAMNRSNRKSALDILVHHVSARRHSRILAGRSFMLGGSVRLREVAPGIFSGDLSGIAGRDVPFWARPRYFPPRELEAIEDWAEKIERLAPPSLAADIRSISGTPSWLLLFFDRLRQIAGSDDPRLRALYPDLELLIHGGVGFAPYRARFARLLEGGHAETREVYPASEGFIAVADRGPDDGLRLAIDTGLFYEFVPVEALDTADPPRLWLAEVETGRDYALVLSTCAGLWGYVIGDTVRFVSLDPPRIVVTGRTSYALSAFGEHLIVEEIEDAVSTAAAAIARDVTDFIVGALVPGADADTAAGGHLYIVEFAGERPSTESFAVFAAAVDSRLAKLNEDYAVHRAGDFGMAPPSIVPVAPGTFAAWMKSRGKLGGQNKVPRVITDDALFRALRSFVDQDPPR